MGKADSVGSGHGERMNVVHYINQFFAGIGGEDKASTLPASRAFLCDILERDRQEVAVTDGEIELELTPFKILTLKLEHQSPQGARRV